MSKFNFYLLHPKNFFIWILVLLMYVLAKFPLKAKRFIGAIIGNLSFLFLKKTKKTIITNIGLCLPEIPKKDQEKITTKVLKNYGHSLVEVSSAWFANEQSINQAFHIENPDLLQQAIDHQKAIIIGTAHFTCLELGLAKASMIFDRYAGMYRKAKNPVLEHVMFQSRHRRGCEMIAHDNVRALIKKLRSNYATVYLPDQPDFDSPTDLLPFFGNPCVTNTAVSKIAKLGHAIILPMCMRFDRSLSKYVLTFYPFFEPNNDVDDTKKLLSIFEHYISEYPEQYIWGYKKFKQRPLCFKQVY